MLGKLDMWQSNTWVVTTQISTKHNITEFYVAFTNRLIVIVIIAIITELTFVGFSNFSLSRDERNVEFINKLVSLILTKMSIIFFLFSFVSYVRVYIYVLEW